MEGGLDGLYDELLDVKYDGRCKECLRNSKRLQRLSADGLTRMEGRTQIM